MATASNEKKTARAWLYNSVSGPLEHNLELSEVPVLREPLGRDQVLVRMHSASLNPADYKIPEVGRMSLAMKPVPACPGMDFAGTVEAVGDDVPRTGLCSVGDRVAGNLGLQQYGSLAEYAVVSTTSGALTRLPGGVAELDAACIGVAGLTALQAVAPHVRAGAGDKVFVNGGGGGVGTFAIQFAKALGCHVTATCSSRTVDLVRSLGADETIDYTTEDIVAKLAAQGQVFRLAVDNVATAQPDLYKASDRYLVPEGIFVQVGGSTALSDIAATASRMLLPSFLGGGKRKFQFIVIKPKHDDLKEIVKMLEDGKVKAVIEQTFDFGDVPKAFEKLKTGRTKGNLVIKISA